jgi:hypothetical protein
MVKINKAAREGATERRVGGKENASEDLIKTVLK